jgi:hypothetical protein
LHYFMREFSEVFGDFEPLSVSGGVFLRR